MKKTLFIKNAIILTLSGFVLRFLGVVFKIWLAKQIGSEGIGLYGLVFSVFVLASTFATSGISTAVTRLCADSLSDGDLSAVKEVLKKSIVLSLFIAFLSVLVLFFGAGFISGVLLGDKRAALSIKILTFSLPFMGVCSCIRGYFLARRKATPSAVSQITEQIIRIGLVFVLVKKTVHFGLAVTCSAVLLGDVVSEILSCLLLYLIFKYDFKKIAKNFVRGTLKTKHGREIIRISFPITLSRYLNSFLRTGENILVPKTLTKYGCSGSEALSGFGIIKGMALPVLFFPSTVINSFSTLLIPEISESAKKGRSALLKRTTEKMLNLTALSSYIFAAIFFVCGKEIGCAVFGDIKVGVMLEYLSPIVPLMYLDGISDGILKGLDCQKFAFFTTVGDSSLRILLILLILPKYGIKGFVFIMYFSNVFTCFLNVGKATNKAKCEIDLIKSVFCPCGFAFIVTLLLDTLIKNFVPCSMVVYIILMSSVSLCLYALYVFRLFGTEIIGDIKGLYSAK